MTITLSHEWLLALTFASGFFLGVAALGVFAIRILANPWK